ncbi:hypothetical protein BGX31_005952 [Mortierella sp. GBA43]|nr:hypothetical protein BGX31_005952 [Mortierella sp. GBA43]
MAPLWKNMTIGDGYNRIPAPNPTIASLQWHSEFIHTLMIEDRFPGRFTMTYPRLRTLRLYMTCPQGKTHGEGDTTSDIGPGSIRDPSPLIAQNSTLVSLFLCRLDPLLAHGFWQAVESLPSLKELTVTDSEVTPTAGPAEFSKVCTKVERLRLYRSLIPMTVITPLLEQDGRLPLIRELRLDAIAGLDDISQLELIGRCPNLVDLVWYGRSIGRESDASRRLREMACFWPALERLQFVITFRDEDLAAVIAGIIKARALVLIRSKMGPLSVLAMRKHFSTLVELRLPNCPDVSSALIGDILCSCPLLELLFGGELAAKDMDANRPWVCRSMRELIVCVVFTETESDLQPMMFERLGTLVRLERLAIAFRMWDVRRFRCGLDLRLTNGLDRLQTLSELKHFSIGDQQLGMEEVEWMLMHWKKLKQVGGSLHADTTLREILKERLHAKGVMA